MSVLEFILQRVILFKLKLLSSCIFGIPILIVHHYREEGDDCENYEYEIGENSMQYVNTLKAYFISVNNMRN